MLSCINDTDGPVYGGKCARTDPLARSKILAATNRKHPNGGAFTEADLEWRSEDGFVVGWKEA